MTTATLSDMPSSTAEVSACAERFDRDGVVLIERLLDDDQLAAARVGVEWLMANARTDLKWIRQRTYEFHDRFPIFVELIEHPLIIDFARAILGDDFHVIAAQASRNLKDDHYAAGAMKIHQDGCFLTDAPGVKHLGFSAMWVMQDTPLEMGPTEFVPGSHISGETFNDDVESQRPAESRVWRRAIPAGSLLIFSHRTWHRGAPNLTDRPRDLITNAYARRIIGKVQLTKRSADGKDAYVAPNDLLATASPMIRQLLSA